MGSGDDKVTLDRAEAEALLALRERFATMAAVVPGAFASYRLRADGAFEIPYATPSLVELFGATPEQLLEDSSLAVERVHPEDLLVLKKAMALSARDLTPLRFEYRINHPERGEIWVECISGPLREVDGATVWHGFVLDICERKRVERELAAERDRIAGIAASSPSAVCSFRRAADGMASFPYATDALANLFGLPLETIQRDAEQALALIHPEDLPRVRARVEESAQTLTPWRGEYRVRNPLRGEIWVEGHTRPIRDESGGVTWNGVITDISARRLAEHKMRTSEERYRQLVDLLPDAVFVNTDDKISFCNAAFVRLMGATSAEQLLGRSPFEIIEEAHHASVRERLATMLSTGEAVPAVEESIVRLDGSRRVVSVVASPMTSDGTTSVLFILHDLTERKRLEEQFRQAHKMEAFGQLAGGVAHDFNNLLTVIIGETELVLSSLAPDHPMTASLEAVHEAGKRAAGQTQQLLTFSRRTVLEPRALDLNATVRETEKMLRRMIGKDIRLTTQLAPKLSKVNIDPSQLGQVLMNLAVNARDAMPRGGSLEIATAEVSLAAEAARARELQPGQYVMLSVRDSGSGIPAEVRARIFEPFFTTKAEGRGTGLGLAVVHGIVTQSGGTIEVDSHEGLGTTFRLWFPVASSPNAC